MVGTAGSSVIDGRPEKVESGGLFVPRYLFVGHDQTNIIQLLVHVQVDQVAHMTKRQH